jgi:hypothetical protein
MIGWYTAVTATTARKTALAEVCVEETVGSVVCGKGKKGT